MDGRKKILRYAEKNYLTKPDYPWIELPEYAVLRRETGKWYGLLMTLAPNRLGLPAGAPVDVINLKCDPILIGSLRARAGFFPAYHMNKEHWITVSLDGSVPDAELYKLLDYSYRLTK